MKRLDPAFAAGALAALLWFVLCLRWFDVAEPWRPAALAAIPPLVLLVATVLAVAAWLRGRRRVLAGPPLALPRLRALRGFGPAILRVHRLDDLVGEVLEV